MHRLSICVSILCLSRAAVTVAAIGGFVEDFSSGAIEYPPWNEVGLNGGEVTEEGLMLTDGVNHFADFYADIHGQGSFKTAVEFSGFSSITSLVSVHFTESGNLFVNWFGQSKLEHSYGLKGALRTGEEDCRLFGFQEAPAPQPGMVARYEFAYDMRKGEIWGSYDNNIDDDTLTLGFEPCHTKLDFTERDGHPFRFSVHPTEPDGVDVMGTVHSISVQPLTPLGDFDEDGEINATDIRLLDEALAAANQDWIFDITHDTIVDVADRDKWINEIFGTYTGDANLDGEFNSADLVHVFQFGEYEDDLVANSTWNTGDWNGDQEFTSRDFVRAFQDGGYERGPRIETISVPEPAGVCLCAGWLILIFGRGKQKGNAKGRN